MTLTLELPPDVEAALAEDARQKGITLERLALDRLWHLSPAEPLTDLSARPPGISPMLALFAQWDAEDATEDPEEIARRNRECDELMASLAANRLNFVGRTDFRGLLGDDEEDAPPAAEA